MPFLFVFTWIKSQCLAPISLLPLASKRLVLLLMHAITFKFIVYALLVLELSILLFVHGLVEFWSFQVCCLSCITCSKAFSLFIYVCGSRAFRFVAYALLVVDISIFLFFVGVAPKFFVNFIHWLRDFGFSPLCKICFNSSIDSKCCLHSQQSSKLFTIPFFLFLLELNHSF